MSASTVHVTASAFPPNGPDSAGRAAFGTAAAPALPTAMVSAKHMFNGAADWQVPAFAEKTPYVPEIDPDYMFDPDVTADILAGFKDNRRVMIQGYHGTGKSTHIEQVAARLNWPCIRINLDGHVTRSDLVGKDTIVLRDGKQVTEFVEGLLPWAMQNPVALIFDEYDAGRPDVMFVIQRLLEQNGQLTLLENNKVIRPHPAFRLFATANTNGLGDTSGLYHGTNQINAAQMDRWNIVTALNYMPAANEVKIITAKVPGIGQDTAENMVRLANMVRKSFIDGNVTLPMSPRAVLNWAQNAMIYGDTEKAFLKSFLNRCDDADKPSIAEYYQRAMGRELNWKQGPQGFAPAPQF